MEILNINGTKVVYHFIPSKLTNVQFLTNIGSCAESPDIWGMAHILEHNFFKGSKKRPTPKDISRAGNDIGGKLNAWTWIDQTVYHITVLNDYFVEGFDILSDMYQNPLFPEDEFKKEINPILSEFRRGEDDPNGYLSDRVMTAIYGSEAGHSTIGTEQSIKDATIDKLHVFRKKYYGGNNTMLSIVGGVTKEQVIRVVSEMFALPAASETFIAAPAKFKGGELTLKKAGITEAVYSLAFPALDRKNPDRTKQSLMTYILGGNDSGLLFERIREELGMSCYGIYASQFHFDPYSCLEISTGIAPGEIEQCHKEVLGQIDWIMNNKIDAQRFNRAKASLKTGIASVQESSAGYNSGISIAILKGETENPIEKLQRELDSITVEDIQEQAQKTFSNAPSFKGILLPEDEASSN